MKLSMLRCLVAVCDNDLNVTDAARELDTLQPSVSKKLMELEEEMGHPLFVRRGKRFIGVTPLCRELLSEAREILLKCDNIAALGKTHRGSMTRGDMRIGTTHTQARYILPAVLQKFRDDYPDSHIQLFQGSPINLVRMLENNQVDMVICTEEIDDNPSLFSVEAYHWNRCLVMLPGHVLADEKDISLEQLAEYPIVTYVHGFTGRQAFDTVFRKVGMFPNVVVAAVDSDIIKTYVREGIGVGIVASISCQEAADSDLVHCSVAHLFPDMRVRVAHHREKIVTEAMQRFISIFQGHTSKLVAKLGALNP